MKKINKCIDDYLKDLEEEVMSILKDISMPLTIKNQKMEPLVLQKKLLLKTKEELEKIKNTNFVAECKMYQKGKNDR